MIHTSFTPEEIGLIDLPVHWTCTIDFPLWYALAPLVAYDAMSIYVLLSCNSDSFHNLISTRYT